MRTNRHAVGAEIETYCGKCKLDRLHVIEALRADGGIDRVICRTCQGRHLFRGAQGAAAGKGAVRRHRAAAATVSEAELGKAKPYAMDGVFKAGDIIHHPTFGPGRVLVMKPGGRMEVSFQAGGKLLVCGVR